jgi:hypothetical protein
MWQQNIPIRKCENEGNPNPKQKRKQDNKTKIEELFQWQQKAYTCSRTFCSSNMYSIDYWPHTMTSPMTSSLVQGKGCILLSNKKPTHWVPVTRLAVLGKFSHEFITLITIRTFLLLMVKSKIPPIPTKLWSPYA